MKLQEMSVGDIREIIRQRGESLSEMELSLISQDPRQGVQRLYQQFRRQQALAAKENLRLETLCLYENEARKKGYAVIAGIDEAGRGPLAGPVVAAAVVLPDNVTIRGIDDSKKLSPAKREKLFYEVQRHALCWAVGEATVEEIDSLNILRASLLAMQRAVERLNCAPDYLLIDAVRIPGMAIPQLPIIKGDGKSISIAAASIMAKVTRDRIMDDIAREFPGYGFAQNKGYGTSDHIEAIKNIGHCKLHRKTFIKNFTVSEACGKLW